MIDYHWQGTPLKDCKSRELKRALRVVGDLLLHWRAEHARLVARKKPADAVQSYVEGMEHYQSVIQEQIGGRK